LQRNGKYSPTLAIFRRKSAAQKNRHVEKMTIFGESATAY